MRKLLWALPLHEYPAKLFVTLTYPGGYFPMDGRECKRHLAKFKARFRRKFGRPVWVWKQEYQWRGALHFMLLIMATGFFDGSPESFDAFRLWASDAWFRSVGSGELSHLEAGVSVTVPYTDVAGYFAYAFGAEKGFHRVGPSPDGRWGQDQVPEGFRHPGRVWGYCGFKPRWRGVSVSRADFVELRRRERRWARTAPGRPRVARTTRVVGEWVVVPPGRSALELLRQLVRGLDAQQGP